jgi:hypothetical protein
MPVPEEVAAGAEHAPAEYETQIAYLRDRAPTDAYEEREEKRRRLAANSAPTSTRRATTMNTAARGAVAACGTTG